MFLVFDSRTATDSAAPFIKHSTTPNTCSLPTAARLCLLLVDGYQLISHFLTVSLTDYGNFKMESCQKETLFFHISVMQQYILFT